MLCAALLTGCATPPQTAALRAQAPAGLPPAQRLTHVPFFAQDDYQCGPAALAMSLRAAGVAVEPAQLTPQVFIPARAGSLQPEMLATARRHGRLAVVLPPRLQTLLAELADGNPVIVLQNLSLPIAPVWHYAVVIGYDLPKQRLLLHSGLTREMGIEFDVFERTWARGGHWAMVVTRPAQLPRNVDPAALLTAAIALERIDTEAAAAAYAALTRRAPQLYGAWFGHGNTAYARGDFAAAAAAFRRAAELQPDSGDAWNNLALTLLAQKNYGAARTAAERAVALGGLRSERYRDTLETISRSHP